MKNVLIYKLSSLTLEDCIDVTDEVRKILKMKNVLLYSHVINDKTWKGNVFQLTNVEKIENIPAQGKLSFGNFEL